ncbi:hypothetical protein MXL46_13845 [Heyndrickxia sporothermodurans]|uniref:Uncharacterized protein n=1 Tax=Heyndrickxia sporothermodurans TaxID=46224 RepID=A0AB37HI86_9BACI|nr:hypothetical protein [Heyndrickxia sporothermodurans]MBL5768440.1 hypothetical protein [Heyndrickxia sporothermodurans]MBL5772081.1 hypothetical protein [Heyndrickxia sporothermodurans]MBL5779342.1 hypothetical protein [Heyndrickxia sporothermodurans]MBL5783589.1 hypothetical protein [Heyndrickxia sporothermodurans]MBL5786331.1 hypothetical protein [Heyndrickxia sporothermodurans]
MSEEKINFIELNKDMNMEEMSAAYNYLIGMMEGYFDPEFGKENISKEKLYDCFSRAVNYAKSESDIIKNLKKE